MPSTAVPWLIFVSSSASSGMLLGQASSATANLRRQQQLAAGGRVDLLNDAQGALVGHRELPYLGHLLAPQLDTTRVGCRRWEDVDQPTSHGELATSLDEVHPVVAGVSQRAHQVVQLDHRPGPQRHRVDVSQPGRLRLEHGAHRGDHHGRTPSSGHRVVGVSEATEHGEALPHRVAAWGEALVRQRLPRRVQGHLLLAHHVGQLGDQVFCLAGGRRHRQHGPPGAGSGHRQCRDEDRSGGRRRAHVEGDRGTGRLHHTAQRR